MPQATGSALVERLKAAAEAQARVHEAAVQVGQDVKAEREAQAPVVEPEPVPEPEPEA